MTRAHLFVLLAAITWLGATADVPSPTDPVAPVDAVTAASYDLKIAFTTSGQVDQLPVKAGDRVKAGDLLMALEDKEGEAIVQQYTLRVKSDVAVREAKQKLDLANIELAQQIRLAKTQDNAPIELERAKANAALGALEVEKATQDAAEAQTQLAQATARHARYAIKAPIDGVVDLITVRVGESVESLKPVLRLVSTDPLYIDAPVPTWQTIKLNLKPGDPVWVTSKLPGYESPTRGKVLYLAQVADSASGSRVVRIELPNPRSMPAGDPVSVSFTMPPGEQPAVSEAHK